jgi:chromosome segregation ATPase
METLIAVFSGVAFLALIVYLWNADSASKYKNDEAIKDESPLQGRVNEPKEGIPPILDSQHVAQLEEKINASKREHAEAFNAAAQASAARSSQRVVELEADNSLLQRRLVELDSQQSSLQGEMASLKQELAKLGVFEQEAGILQKEKAELIEQLGKSEIENAANARASLALQNLEAKQTEIEGTLASLREENKRLLGEIAELRSSLRDKIKTQLDGLQELYKNLTPGLN